MRNSNLAVLTMTVIAGGAFLSGCGGSDASPDEGRASTTSATTAPVPAIPACLPVQARSFPDRTALSRGENVRLAFGGQKFTVRLERIGSPPRVARRALSTGVYTSKGRFTTAVLSITNDGSEPIETAATVGRALRLRAGNKLFGRADQSPGCEFISVSAARDAKLTSSEEDLAPGKTYRTVFVFVAPQNGERSIVVESDNVVGG